MNNKLNVFALFHLYFSFFGLFGFIILSMFFGSDMLWGTIYCGLTGIILAFTDKYWDEEVMKKQ